MNAHVKPFKPGDHNEVFPGLADDPYALRRKLSEPSVCPNCGAVYRDGRWQWLARPAQASQVVCTACHRIADGMPAGYVYISGSFARERRAEMLNLIHHHEERAKAGHPMKRIMSVSESGDTTIVATTDVHLARDIGSALKSAFQGALDVKYSRDENLVRVYWQR
ncbi:MAG: BCAM0308 family protein [Trinickia sp.]|uniref:BCAM0308 family protein n=1 Tax=Trinickia sp. TaxID=2571163 RepID=UPI003F81B0F6